MILDKRYWLMILALGIMLSLVGTVLSVGDNSLDNFTSTTMSSEWTITDAVGSAANSLTNNPGHLQIIIPANKTYNCRDNINTCFNIMKTMQNGDTTYETKIDSTTINQRYQSYGIILYQDNQNYLTYELWAQGNVIRPVIWKISGGITTAIINSPITLSSSNYLRIIKSGTTFTTYYSTDGNNWNTTSIYNTALTINNAGITINSYGNNQGITTNFDYMKIGNPQIVAQNFTLNVLKSGTGQGTLTSNPAGIDCGATCTSIYNSGQSVTLTATPAANSTFTAWSGACSGTGNCVFNMTQNQTVNAQFTSNTINQTDSLAPNVTITSPTNNQTINVATINITGTATDNIAVRNVQVKINNAAWTNATGTTTWNTTATLIAGTNTIQIQAFDTSNNPSTIKTINVTYNIPVIQNYTLTITKSGTGQGTVTSNGINCGATCTAKYTAGTSVTLTATPNANNTFTTWTGACSGAGTCTINMTQNRTANAQFDNQTSQPAGIILAYGLNEGVGTVVTDLSPSNIVGNINGATWTVGKYSNALSFDGSSGYVAMGVASKLGLTGSMTWSAWVNNAAWPVDDGMIISKGDDISGWQFKNTKDRGPRTFGVGVFTGGTNIQRYSATTITLNTWYYVAAVYNAQAQTLNIYVNGVLDNGYLDGTVPASQVVSSANAFIGKRTSNYGTFSFNGIIDEVRVYNRSLTQAEIVADMNTPVGGSPIPQDTTPPVVAMTSPTNGATVVGTISLTATATDNDLMSNVQFVVDGTNYSNPDTSTPYTVSLDTTTLSNAAHTITAIATDRSGNTATATPVSITVNNPDTTPPTLSVGIIPLSPQPNQAVTFTATATDTNSIASLNLIVQGVLRNSNCTTIGNTRTCTYIASSGFANNTNVAYSANATDNSANHNLASTSGNVLVKDLTYRPWVTTYYGAWTNMAYGTLDFTAWPNEINWTGIDFVVHFENSNINSATPPYFEPAIPTTTNARDLLCDTSFCVAQYNYQYCNCPHPNGQQLLIDTVHSYGGKVLLGVVAVNPAELKIVLSDNAAMNVMVDAIVNYGKQHNYDGVDINIEGIWTAQPTIDMNTAFITAIRNRMNQDPSSNFRYITLAPQPSDRDRYDVNVINTMVDQVNMQMGNAGGLSSPAGNVAWYLNPLYRGNTPDWPSNVDPNDWDVHWVWGPLQWVALGYSPSKIGIGTPSNAFIYKGTDQLYGVYSDYGVNCNRADWEALLNNGGTLYWDDVRKANYIKGTAIRTEGNNNWQGCGLTAGQKFFANDETPQAYQAEVAWMIQHQLGGIMIYEVATDLKKDVAFDQRLPNHKAIIQALGR